MQSVNRHSKNLTIYTLISTTSKHMTYLFVILPTVLFSFNGPCTPSRGKFYVNKPIHEIRLIYKVVQIWLGLIVYSLHTKIPSYLNHLVHT